MAIAEKLAEEWAKGEASRMVFEIKATLQNAKNVLGETDMRVSEIIAADSIDDVDQEIKAEGLACIQIVRAAKDALADHSDFLDWDQP